MVKEKKRTKTSSLLLKMNLRTIFHSKLQFLAVILITVLAMTLYVGLTSNAKSINDRVNELYEGSNVADLWVTTAYHDDKDMKNIKDIIGDDGEVEGRFLMPAKLQTFDGTALMSKNLPKINKPSTTDNTATENFFIIDERLLETHNNPASIIRWYDEEGNYLKVPVHFSISSYLKQLEETKLGTFDGKERSLLDAITVCLKDGKDNILDEPYLTLNFQITGTMSFAENVQNSQMNNTSFLLSIDYFRNEFLKVLNDTFATPTEVLPGDPDFELKSLIKLLDINSMMPGLIESATADNQYVVKTNKGVNVEQKMQDIKTYFDSKIDKKNLLMCTQLDSLYSNITIQNDIVQASQLAYIFPVIFFLVAILVVLTTISQIIIKDRIQIGTMKAIGISTGKVIMHYMALSIYIVLIGIILGIIIGPFIIPMIMTQKYDILYSLPKVKYTLAIPEMLISTIVVLGITGLVTWLVVRKQANLRPTEGMRPKEIKIAKATKTKGKITSKSIPFRMAIRNIKLNWAKSLMVMIGVAGCTALLVCGFGIDDTLDHGIDNDVHYFFNSNIYTTYSNNSSNKEEIMAIDGVTEMEEYTYLPTMISFNDGTYQTYVTVIDENSKFFKIENFELADTIIVSNKVAKAMNIKVGDTISFSSIGMNFTGEVGLILDCFYMHGIYVNSAYNDYGSMSNIKTNAWINASSGTDLDMLVEKINDVSGVSNSMTLQKSIDLIDSYMSSISLMTLAVKVFAILLAIVVLYNLSLLNFKERSRDVATLKVLGFSKFEINNSLFFESMILTIVGVGIGLLLGKPLEILVMVVNTTPLVEFLYTVFTSSYLISLGLTVGTAIFVNWILGFKIKKIKMVESLKSVE